jgi:hypothetical protein
LTLRVTQKPVTPPSDRNKDDKLDIIAPSTPKNTRFVPQSERKEEKKPLLTEQPRVAQTPFFRSDPQNLSKDQVRAMLKKFNFYCGKDSWTEGFDNPGGTGFDNDFEIINNRVVYDKASRLMWQRGGSEKYLFVDQTQDYIDSLNRVGFAGYRDWRLPTLEEAMSLME